VPEGMGDTASSMAVNAPDDAPRLPDKARDLAMQVETALDSVGATLSPLTARVAGFYEPKPEQTLVSLPPYSYWPKGPMKENQPIAEVGLLGGTKPCRGRMTYDTGAAFTLISSEVAKCAGLQISPATGSYTTASGTPAPLCGCTDLTIQVHDRLAIKLEGVRVQEMGGEWQFLLGSDIMRGQHGVLDAVVPVPGKSVTWSLPVLRMSYDCDIENPCGPVGAPGRMCEVGDKLQELPPPPTASTDGPTSLLAVKCRFLNERELQSLKQIVDERQAILDKDYDRERVQALCERLHQWALDRRLPRPLRIALGRCVRRR